MGGSRGVSQPQVTWRKLNLSSLNSQALGARRSATPRASQPGDQSLSDSDSVVCQPCNGPSLAKRQGFVNPPGPSVLRDAVGSHYTSMQLEATASVLSHWVSIRAEYQFTENPISGESGVF
jgi:hypothetical protein